MTKGKGAITEVKPKPAAILSAEVVGYSRVMADSQQVKPEYPGLALVE